MKLSSLCGGTITEDYESKLPLAVARILNKKSKWAHKESENAEELAETALHDAARWDPTKNKRYFLYIAKQIANRTWAQEDGPMLQDALKIFSKKRNDWPGHKDVFQYRSWRDLQKDTEIYKQKNEDDTASGYDQDYMKTWRKLSREESHVVLDETVRIKKRDGKMERVNYKIMQCDGSNAATLYGIGTTWCTAATPFNKSKLTTTEIVQAIKQTMEYRPDTSEHPFWDIHGDFQYFTNLQKAMNPGWESEPVLTPSRDETLLNPNPYFMNAYHTAKGYLESGPLYILFKNKKPYMQMSSAGDMMDATDQGLIKAGAATNYILRKFLEVLPSSYVTPGDQRPGYSRELSSVLTDRLDTPLRRRDR